MKAQPVSFIDLLLVDKEYHLMIESIEWNRVHIIIQGSITTNNDKNPDSVYNDLKYYLYSPSLDKTLECSKCKTENGKFTIDINLMSIDNLSPLFKGSWYFFTVIGNRKIYSRVSNNIREKINTFTMIYNFRGSRYIARPTSTNIGSFFLIEILIYGFKYKAKRNLNYFKRNTKQIFYKILISLIRLFVKKTGKRILFTSDSREDISGNEKCIYDRLIERGLDKEFTILTSFKPSITNYRALKEKFRIAYNLAVADFIFVDDYQPIIYNTNFTPGTEIIQLWHASGPFKTVGYSRIGKPGGPDPFKDTHKNYTKVIVSSDHAVQFYAEAFGVDESIVYPIGIPRMDMFFDEAKKEEIRNEFFEKYPSLKGKEIIMFAPTFRGYGPSTAFYDFQLIDFKALAEVCRKRNAVTIFKMHPFITESCEIPKEFSDVCIDLSEYREINDILIVADLLITDYSSVVFEYCTLNRPMLFFAYDLEQYVAERDFYEDFKGFVPGRIVRTFDELIQAINKNEFEIEKVEDFKHRYFNRFDNGATDRIIDEFILTK